MQSTKGGDGGRRARLSPTKKKSDPLVAANPANLKILITTPIDKDTIIAPGLLKLWEWPVRVPSTIAGCESGVAV